MHGSVWSYMYLCPISKSKRQISPTPLRKLTSQKFICKDRGEGRGYAALSLHCEDRKFSPIFDPILQVAWYETCDGLMGHTSFNGVIQWSDYTTTVDKMSAEKSIFVEKLPFCLSGPP